MMGDHGMGATHGDKALQVRTVMLIPQFLEVIWTNFPQTPLPGLSFYPFVPFQNVTLFSVTRRSRSDVGHSLTHSLTHSGDRLN